MLSLHDLLLRAGGDLRRQHDRLPRALGELVLRDLLRAAVRVSADGDTGAKRARRGAKPTRSHSVRAATDDGRRGDVTTRDGRNRARCHGGQRDPRHTRARRVVCGGRGGEGRGRRRYEPGIDRCWLTFKISER